MAWSSCLEACSKPTPRLRFATTLADATPCSRYRPRGRARHSPKIGTSSCHPQTSASGLCKTASVSPERAWTVRSSHTTLGRELGLLRGGRRFSARRPRVRLRACRGVGARGGGGRHGHVDLVGRVADHDGRGAVDESLEVVSCRMPSPVSRARALCVV